MRSSFVLLHVLALVLNLRAQDDYKPGPDSIVQAGVPKGEMLKGTYTAKEGSVFPGTERGYDIYLPAGYDPSTSSGANGRPAPFMVFQDGVIYNAPVVFDNLIAKHELPPLIGIFIKPGIVPAANPNALPRYNRSYEYDSVSDTYSRFIIDELLPALEAKHSLKLSTDPNDAAICGNSSGGICAFMTAWHRPDRIRRVFSGVGTYVGIHGADQLPVLVRKFEPKPLRIYLQSGEHDNDLYCGDWWMANQTMERALKWAGYDVNHTWGTGGHNSKHATAIFPDVLRWLWRDYATAKEIKANPRGESKWLGYSVLGDGKWLEVQYKTKHDPNEAVAITSNSVGQLLVCKADGAIVGVSGDAAPKSFVNLPEAAASMIFDNNGDVLASIPNYSSTVVPKLLRISQGMLEPIDIGLSTLGLIIARNDGLGFSSYGGGLTFLAHGKPVAGKLYNEDQLTHNPVGLTFSPDQSWLYVSNRFNRNISVIQVTKNGDLANAQQFYQLDATSDGELEVGGLCVDTNGWLYVATALGVQVLDQAGRVNFIIPTPQQPYDVCFGGKDLGELFIACGDKIYKRPTKAHGIVSGQMAPIKPPPPKL